MKASSCARRSRRASRAGATTAPCPSTTHFIMCATPPPRHHALSQFTCSQFSAPLAAADVTERLPRPTMTATRKFKATVPATWHGPRISYQPRVNATSSLRRHSWSVLVRGRAAGRPLKRSWPGMRTGTRTRPSTWQVHAAWHAYAYSSRIASRHVDGRRAGIERRWSYLSGAMARSLGRRYIGSSGKSWCSTW